MATREMTNLHHRVLPLFFKILFDFAGKAVQDRRPSESDRYIRVTSDVAWMGDISNSDRVWSNMNDQGDRYTLCFQRDSLSQCNGRHARPRSGSGSPSERPHNALDWTPAWLSQQIVRLAASGSPSRLGSAWECGEDASLNSLEPRCLLAGAAIGQWEGVVDQAPDPVRMVVDASAFDGSANGSYWLALEAKPAAGSTLDPSAVRVRDSRGQWMTPIIERDDRLQGSVRTSTSLTILELPFGTYEVFVDGASGTTGRYELVSSLAGDVNGDRRVDLGDLDAFTTAGDGQLVGDLNGDGTVDLADLDLFGQDAGSSDLNGDGVVDLVDLDLLSVAMAGDHTSHGTTGTRSADADLNGDGMVTVADLNLIGRSLGSQAMVLTGGNGFDVLSTAPAQVRAAEGAYAFGASARAIAQFNVVPHQVISGTFDVGVVAFHVHGIERVAFSVDGGPWLNVHAPSFNPRTETLEYRATLETADLPAGDVEIRAIAFPVVGEPLVLDTRGIKDAKDQGGDPVGLFLHVAGTASGSGPVVRLARGGLETIPDAIDFLMDRYGTVGHATIELPAGTYTFGAERSRPETPEGGYLTLRPAPGTDRDGVIFTEVELNAGFDDANVHVQEVTIAGTELNDGGRLIPIFQGGRDGWLWLDGILWQGQARTKGDVVKKNTFARVYITDTEMFDAERPFAQARLVRNSSAVRVFEDAIRSVDLTINVEVTDLLSLDGGHPDVWQYFYEDGPYDNVIVYGLRALPDLSIPGNAIHGQGLNLSTGINSAFVDVEIDNRRNRLADRPGIGHHNLGAGGDFSNILIADSTFFGETNRLNSGSFASLDWFVFRDVEMPDESDPMKFSDRENVYYTTRF